MVHASARHALEQRKKYAPWLDTDDDILVANAMLIILSRLLKMLNNQIEAQGESFLEHGGFSERLSAKRLKAREKSQEPSPTCPHCGLSMRRRKSVKGDFWGCSGYPSCKGTRPMVEQTVKPVNKVNKVLFRAQKTLVNQ